MEPCTFIGRKGVLDSSYCLHQVAKAAWASFPHTSVLFPLNLTTYTYTIQLSQYRTPPTIQTPQVTQGGKEKKKKSSNHETYNLKKGGTKEVGHYCNLDSRKQVKLYNVRRIFQCCLTTDEWSHETGQWINLRCALPQKLQPPFTTRTPSYVKITTTLSRDLW